ncbi:MAG TPA: CehA/McbA family metallohydrolase [Blastocatellia bacterium]|nr:CehA/McbA family metallohydrolase [Blastocatellia bacterium]HMV81755.1 CehA/McbA family metallohydrolase [Blastocatellia bacterium]HMX26259.1 CehA/McbA family metallohydrolase [Blastocatellia bacterium]HMY71235.1 CehA/McbA family metallohydrolase [Blastocatellia bacterium]HMZ18190.1 CehA/McbA family metallohydrolase [Blastocatellia bacterium]
MLSTRAFAALAFAMIAILAGAFPNFFAQEKKLNWYKGNTHTHTINSDGDSTPDEVVRWYRERGYNFLVLSDHNYLTEVSGLNSVLGAKEKFLLIPGEEVTDKFEKKDIHINGLNPREPVQPLHGESVVATIQNNVNAIRKVEGVPHVNHPNFNWSITADDLKRIKNLRLFEIYNGHPTVNNLGGGGVPGLEAMWDDILSSGMTLYGIAVDDAHYFKTPWDKTRSSPGHGWVMVRAERLGATEILQAMERGDFYASTGVTLRDYQSDKKQITINIAEQPATSKYIVQFIGQWGKVLKEVTNNPAVYTFKGDEAYVRAKVIESNGKAAWTQPVFLNK